MFLHRKELIQPVKVGKPDARFGIFLLEQFGGATGELTAALQVLLVWTAPDGINVPE